MKLGGNEIAATLSFSILLFLFPVKGEFNPPTRSRSNLIANLMFVDVREVSRRPRPRTPDLVHFSHKL